MNCPKCGEPMEQISASPIIIIGVGSVGKHSVWKCPDKDCVINCQECNGVGCPCCQDTWDDWHDEH